MFENAGRKVVLITLLLLGSLALLFLQDQPFRLGLDLEGGTRLVYRFDFDAARKEGTLGATESETDILNQTVTIMRNRVDPNGVLDPTIRPEFPDRVIIELPGNVGRENVSAETQLAGGIQLTERELTLENGEAFPATGIVQIGDEQIRYAGREGNRLLGLERGHEGQLEAHQLGDRVKLVSADAIRAAIENLGELAFMLVAEPRDYTGKGTDSAKEQEKLSTWQAANPGVPVTVFNSVPPEQGGPDPSIRWYPTHFSENYGPPMAVLEPRKPSEDIRGAALARIHQSQDRWGYPAVGFEIKPERIEDFADFTGENVNRRMAIVLNGEVRSAPTLNTKLVGGGIIEGKFKDEEVKSLITVLRSGSLKLKPTLEHDERVGATLGDDYVNRGLYSGILSIGLVIAFMIVYYRRLGLFAGLALVSNLILFMGGLAVLHATLTLPGIAGIVLTVGMAVDANILIFDRLREEADKGRNVRQAAKAGFEKALSAIVDSNVTTFLTAVILYRLGTGPVRGFAVTLMIGILTSVFSALVTTRVFVHLALERGAVRFAMGRWMADAKYDFMSKTRLALTASAVVIVAGLIGFFVLPDKEKFGIDFTGGVEAQIHTEQPQSVDRIRQLVGAIQAGGIGQSAEVRSVLNSEQEGGFTQFRIQFKTVQEGTAVGEGESLRPELRKALGEVLLQDPIQLTLNEQADKAQVTGLIYFEKLHPEPDVAARLEAAGLRDATVTVGDRKGSYEIAATTAIGRNGTELAQAVHDAFLGSSDSDGVAFELADPIPVWSQVGPQVVGELRDKALLALVASLFMTVMYIRVRFAEYSYGIAAMVAVLHDVLVTLAALTFGNHLGLISGEINLAMIAVFLTIIGYSINDTIVIFDRVRENLPRMKVPLREVLNTSINETLSRTVMTSLTTLMVVVIQYLFNVGTGNLLESISFAMMFGMVSGIYSTIFVANPIFLWLETRSGRGGAQARALQEEQRRLSEKQRREESDPLAEGV